MKHALSLLLLIFFACSVERPSRAEISQTIPMCPSLTNGTQPCYPYTNVAPAVTQVTTGGVAVTAFPANTAIKGGWLYNPSTATTNLCVAIGATATATTGGATSCFPPGYTFTITPTLQAVSVNASDSAHAFSGSAYQ